MKVNSLSEINRLFPKMKSRKRQPKTEKERKCRVCEGTMVKKAGTNVWVCTGTVKVPDEKHKGKFIDKPCSNVAFSKS